MHEKRFSIFISSTYEDLKEERRAVQDVVISSGDFPVQMESFPAADEDQFNFIRSLIDKCDYYVLIVAGRYGTPADDGMSYTEKEYRYAISKDIPVLVMLRGDRGNIPIGKSEQSTEGKERLTKFIEEIQRNRLRKEWVTTDQLKLAVREAIDHAKATKPAAGWIRGDTAASLEIMEELNEARKLVDDYRNKLGASEIESSLPALPSIRDQLEFDLRPASVKVRGRLTSGSDARVRTSWIGAFPVFYAKLCWGISDWDGDRRYHIETRESLGALGSAYASELASFDTRGLFEISDATLRRLLSYYVEVGLVNDYGETPFTAAAERVARRLVIPMDGQSAFRLVSGSIEKRVYSSSESNLDDEIPF